jgi:pimeloyl-ACP methyl ester carboxylesterase
MLRTPDSRFASLPGWSYPPKYLEGLPELCGARLHYVDIPAQAVGSAARPISGPVSGPVAGQETRQPAQTGPKVALCLHGNPSWGYLYRKMAPVFTEAGLRVVIPDLVGFGRSDKPELDSAHTFDYHRNYLLALIKHLDLREVLLVVQDWGGIFGLTLPMAMPERFSHLLAMNTTLGVGTSLSEGFIQWRNYCNKNPDLDPGPLLKRGKPDMSKEEAATYSAPFPDVSFKAALRAFPNLVPASPEAEGASISRQAAEYWRNSWQGKSFMAIGTEDPVLGPAVMQELQKLIRNCPEPLMVKGGHFLQEWGEPIARACLDHFGIKH